MKNQLTKFVLILICINFTLSSKNKQIFDFIRQANSNKGNNNQHEKLSRPVTIIDDSESNNRAVTPIGIEDEVNFIEKGDKLTKKFEDADEFEENTAESLNEENLKLRSNSIIEKDNDDVQKEQGDVQPAFIEKPIKNKSNLRSSSFDAEEASKEILSLLKDIKKRLIKDSFRRKSMELINKFQKIKKEKK